MNIAKLKQFGTAVLVVVIASAIFGVVLFGHYRLWPRHDLTPVVTARKDEKTAAGAAGLRSSPPDPAAPQLIKPDGDLPPARDARFVALQRQRVDSFGDMEVCLFTVLAFDRESFGPALLVGCHAASPASSATAMALC